jgi:hypothetical protein
MLHLSNKRQIGTPGEITECGESFRITGGLRDTPHPAQVTFYCDEPCPSCFGNRAGKGDKLAASYLEAARAKAGR